MEAQAAPTNDGAEPLKITELNRLYLEADSCDQEIFAEQRTNLLLVAGSHYNKKDSRFFSRIRDDKQLSKEQKLRLTKNHLGYIAKRWVNNIISHAPDVGVYPKHDKELCDVKAAELNQSVWMDFKEKTHFRDRRLQYCEDFVQQGEVAVKAFYDPNAGDFLGYEAEVDEVGNPLLDELQQMRPSKRAVFKGALVHERIDGFNLLRDPTAKNMDEAKWVCYRKMTDVKELKLMVGNNVELLALIEESANDVYTVFEGSTGNYRATKGQTMLREFYWRPCILYPQGWFAITTERGILWEGELPFGIFPIIYKGCERITTSARHRSWIAQLRPFQIEINRCASKIAEAQIALGDDKLLIQHGTKVTPGVALPGIRSVQFQGQQPGILQGRSGDQYLNYMTANIEEMYKVALIDDAPKDVQNDPWGMLFKSIRQKEKFSLYAQKFESFLIDLCQITLELARRYYDDQMRIEAVGRKEWVNIAEFKQQEKYGVQIRLEAQSEDIETRMGRQLVLNHALQYAGTQLKKDELGQLLRAMPFLNEDEAFGDMTIDLDSVTNDILALDRGEYRPAKKYEEHKYIVRKLTGRTKQADYEMLSPQVKKLYDMKISEHEEKLAIEAEELKAAQAGFIPTGGPLVTVQFYVDDPMSPGRTRQARVPFEAIQWLIKQIDKQGMAQKDLDRLPAEALIETSHMMSPHAPQGNAWERIAQGPSTSPPSSRPVAGPLGPN